jgi:excinuclease ABC subunit A
MASIWINPSTSCRKSTATLFLYGSNGEEIEFSYVNDRGTVFKRRHVFEGVIPNMDRRYRETESSSVRDELAKYVSTAACKTCEGTRLCEDARSVYVDDRTLPSITSMPVGDAEAYFNALELSGRQGEIADKILKELRARYRFLVDVGLNYLTLNRSAETLSGGEAQRIRLASQIGAGLVGVMYILDEPSIGLHQRDNERLLRTLIHLRDLGNTVLVVEHDEDAIRNADHIIDIGPGAGVHGGEVVVSGTMQDVIDSSQSLTGAYLSGEALDCDPVKAARRQTQAQHSHQRCTRQQPAERHAGAATRVAHLRDRRCRARASRLSLTARSTLWPPPHLNGATTLKAARMTASQDWRSSINVSTSTRARSVAHRVPIPPPIPASSRRFASCSRAPRKRAQGATSPGVSALTSAVDAAKPARATGSQKSKCIFCPISMCPAMSARASAITGRRWRLNSRTSTSPRYSNLTVEDALSFFEAVPAIHRKLQTLMDVGLSYIRLGQAATTLSGGEAQRVKLSRELSKRDTGNTLYILDEPTTGLHFEDIRQLLEVLHRLRDGGNTVVIIEHNLDVIKTADWLIDLGPEGGSGGGQIIATGTPEDVAATKASHTGRFLAPLLPAPKKSATKKASSTKTRSKAA